MTEDRRKNSKTASYMRRPRRVAIGPRQLSAQERSWIEEILQHNPRWADVDLKGTLVVGRGDCGCTDCATVYLDRPSPQNPSLLGTKGYIGRIEIRTVDDFAITVTLDHLDGKLYELDVNPLDLRVPGDRTLGKTWQEKGHTIVSM